MMNERNLMDNKIIFKNKKINMPYIIISVVWFMLAVS